MTDRQMTTVKNWLTIGGTIAAITFAWATLSAQVTALDVRKADRIEIEELRLMLRAAEERAIRIDERTQRIERHLCRSRPNDIGC